MPSVYSVGKNSPFWKGLILICFFKIFLSLLNSNCICCNFLSCGFYINLYVNSISKMAILPPNASVMLVRLKSVKMKTEINE